MHVLVLLVDFLGVRFRGKPCQALLVDVNTKGFIARNDYVNTQVKLMAIDQERVRDVL